MVGGELAGGQRDRAVRVVDGVFGGVPAAVSSVIEMCWIVPPLSGPSSVITAQCRPLRDKVIW